MTDNGNGTYTVIYTPAEGAEGDYGMNITINDEAMFGGVPVLVQIARMGRERARRSPTRPGTRRGSVMRAHVGRRNRGGPAPACGAPQRLT